VLEEVADILFNGNEVVFSEEVNDLVDSEGGSGKTSDTLESSVWFKARTFSEDLSGDFDVLFSIGKGVKEAGDFVFSGKSDHF